MATILQNNFRAAFNDSKSPLVANVLILRVLAGDYSESVEIGPGGVEPGVDKQIIGNLYLLVADENTLPLMGQAEAFVMRLEHESRMVDYFTFADVDTARAFMTANS